jgi:RHS repeat-associated protein
MPQQIYYYADGSGSTSYLADGTGLLLEKYTYDVGGKPTFLSPTGTTLTGGGAYGVDMLFTGQKWYTGYGILDLRNRAYYPSLGRFLQPDPIGFGGDPSNLYRYCGNNPVNWSDPYGLFQARPFFGGLLSVGVGGGIIFGSAVADFFSAGTLAPATPLEAYFAGSFISSGFAGIAVGLAGSDEHPITADIPTPLVGLASAVGPKTARTVDAIETMISLGGGIKTGANAESAFESYNNLAGMATDLYNLGKIALDSIIPVETSNTLTDGGIGPDGIPIINSAVEMSNPTASGSGPSRSGGGVPGALMPGTPAYYAHQDGLAALAGLYLATFYGGQPGEGFHPVSPDKE